MEARTPSVPEELIPRKLFPLRDPSLPHQIVIMYDGISCNCRRMRKHAKGGFNVYEIFAKPCNADEALAAYYDPANHKGLRYAG